MSVLVFKKQCLILPIVQSVSQSIIARWVHYFGKFPICVSTIENINVSKRSTGWANGPKRNNG